MAGSGRRVFSPGEVLTASNTMNYLMDQTVMSFAGTAARGSAIGTAVAEGMVSYLADTNAVEVYDGSIWQRVYPSVANAGEIIQIVNARYTVSVTNNTTTYVDTGLTATITPTSASNKILVIASQNGITKTTGDAENSVITRITRNGTEIHILGSLVGYSPTAGFLAGLSVSGTYLDEPATTSALTYKTQFKNYKNASSTYVQAYNEHSSITLLEVKG